MIVESEVGVWSVDATCHSCRLVYPNGHACDRSPIWLVHNFLNATCIVQKSSIGGWYNDLPLWVDKVQFLFVQEESAELVSPSFYGLDLVFVLFFVPLWICIIILECSVPFVWGMIVSKSKVGIPPCCQCSTSIVQAGPTQAVVHWLNPYFLDSWSSEYYMYCMKMVKEWIIYKTLHLRKIQCSFWVCVQLELVAPWLW